MKHFLSACLLFMILTPVFGQKQGNIWVFGQGGALDFNSGTPIPFSGSQIFATPAQIGDFTGSEGCSSIADSSGALLFYSNGDKVWNRLHHLMPNGDSLDGFYSSTSAALAIPMPGSESRYYLFTTDGLERQLANGLRYSIVDICLDNGNGDIVREQKNIPLLDTAAEKLCAIAHPNGTDIWLIAHKYRTNAFYAYLITPSGINPPVITSIGSVHTGTSLGGFGAAIGQMKASSDGHKIALVFSNVNPAVGELFDFDPATGTLSNPVSLQTDGNEYGIEFSPDNSKLYITNIHGLFQFDISSGNQTAINASRIQLTSVVCIPSPLQLGPDGKIYVARCSNYLGVIQLPNAAGTGCNYIDNGLSISPAASNTSLPGFIAGYHYKNTKYPDCQQLEVDELMLSDNSTIYPNPMTSETILTVAAPLADAGLTIVNVFGQPVRQMQHLSGRTIVLEREGLPAGIYFIRVTEGSRTITIKKITVTE